MGAAQERTIEYRIDQAGVTVRRETVTDEHVGFAWRTIVSWCNGIDSAVSMTLHEVDKKPILFGYSVTFGDRVCSIKGGKPSKHIDLVVPTDEVLPRHLYSRNAGEHGFIYKVKGVPRRVQGSEFWYEEGEPYTGIVTLVGLAYEVDFALCTTEQGEYAVFRFGDLQQPVLPPTRATDGIRVFVEPGTGGIDSPQRPGDAGYDLRAAKGGMIPNGAWDAIETGVHIEIPAGHVGMICDRSSLAGRGMSVRGGIIDASFRGMIKVMLHNDNYGTFEYQPGDRIAQMLILPVVTLPLVTVGALDELSPTERGSAGFGSTGA